jgi:hypothetical protein
MIRMTAKLIIVTVALMIVWACAAPARKTIRTVSYNVPLNDGVADSAFLGDMEREIVKQLNDLRVHPKAYADYLMDLRNRRGGIMGEMVKAGSEKEQITAGLDEAVQVLARTERMPPFRVSRGLSLAAADLVKDHGPRGLTGRKGSDGKSPFDRMNRYGRWEGQAAENVSYGYTDGEAVVVGMMIDGSISGREQRKNLFNRSFGLIGIACGKHNVYRAMCVIDFAQSYTERPSLSER